MFTSLARIGTPQSAAVAAPYLRSDDAERAHRRAGRPARDAAAARPELAGVAGGSRRGRAAAGLRARARTAGADALGLLGALLEREADVNVCAAAVEVAGRDRRRHDACRPWRAAPSASPTSRSWSSPSRSPQIASDRPPKANVAEPAAVTEEEFRRLCEFLYRRTGMIFTEAKRYYVERRVNERMAATGATSFASYFAPPAQRPGRRGRAVHQRLHRQRDLLLPRGSPAPVPDRRPAGRAHPGQARRRADPHLVGALLDRRGALFDRHVAAGELAAGRRLRHRDHRLGHRHAGAGGRGRRGVRQARADAADAGRDGEILRTARRGELAHPGRPARLGALRAGQHGRAAGDRPRSAASTSSSAATC